ncbi:MAG: nitroreductase family deazaflavin-dependent oxidoreductase [Chloroflexi bacterium]|nr:nitroreductase family deazaflavin-dependent oxidoreductase [Chloroflexota bacterium]
MTKYDRPGFITKSVGNVIVMLLTRLGISAGGANTLVVRGRNSGEPRSVPVNPLDYDGARYLVAPRGNTEWVRNLRAAGEGELRLGSKRKTVTAVEVGDEEKPPVLRAYLENWASATKGSFGVDEKATDEELRDIAPDHPVFRITS